MIAGQEHLVAVRRGAGDKLRREIAAGARLALDDELLTEHLGHLQRHQPRDGVGAAAGRERDCNADRPVRPAGLRDRGAREIWRSGGGCG